MEATVKLCAQIITLTIWIGIGVAMIVMGALYKNDCPIQPYIPIFLLVSGATHLVTFFIMFLRLVCQTIIMIFESFVGIFSFVWFIVGSVWVFRVYNDYVGQCNPDLYLFAFGILLFEYVVIGLAMVGSCCCAITRNVVYETLE
ncbi:transmembrane protein 272 [Bombina bombina]|uniref:transmembrane protein 272 n=1 Tax=Bombina bombina TaxID=8345 RepID=UPI00235ABCD7|nr:transmembrane protein 272 [Bombina bombina]